VEQWGPDILSINWRHILTIWNQRNTGTLGSTETDKEEKRKEKLITIIWELQQKYQDIQHTHKILIDTMEEILIEMSEAQLIAYLHRAKIITKIHAKPRQIGIRRYLLQKDKSELDPGETM
jgi:hypothetical protein